MSSTNWRANRLTRALIAPRPTAAIAGYTHLRAQQSRDAAAAAAIRHDMQHVAQRLDRLEERVAALAGEEQGQAAEPPAGGRRLARVSEIP